MKYKKEQVQQLRKNFISKTSWLKVRTKQCDVRCTECKKFYSDIEDDKIAAMTVEGKGALHICNSCANKYVALGVQDLDEEIQIRNNNRDNIISEIKNMYNQNVPYNIRNLEDLSLEKLVEIRDEKLKDIEYQKFLDSIDSSNWKIEEYLVKQYGVIIDKEYLKHTSQIQDYFYDTCYDYNMFNCGQGYYQDKAEVIIFIDGKFYKVQLTAEIDSAKQDVGDRLYWFDGLKSVGFDEIEKPKEKLKEIYEYKFTAELLPEDKIKLDSIIEQFLKKNV